MHILIAPNAFKNSLAAPLAAKSIERGFVKSSFDCTTECFPIGDGGDGTGDLLIDQHNGERIVVEVQDPLGRNIDASYGLIDNGNTAVIEMANASGLRLLSDHELDPLRATSFGTGQLMVAALERGVKKIILCMGGSATVDGGTGILSALGIRFLNANDETLTAIGDFDQLRRIDRTGLHPSIANCDVMILCDVDNPLTGDTGAAAVFGPQKGADTAAVQRLDQNLSKLSEMIFSTTGKDIAKLIHAGTAGGAAGGLHGLINARLVNGANSFLELTGFAHSLQSAQLVVTGEGSIDEQTLQGKGPYAVAALAKQKNIPVAGLAGRVPDAPGEQLLSYFNPLININQTFTTIEEAMASTAINLERAAFELGEKYAGK